jgi:hypothetical protein
LPLFLATGASLLGGRTRGPPAAIPAPT